MDIIEWYSESVTAKYFEEADLKAGRGRIYHLSGNNTSGYIIYDERYSRKGKIIAYGKLGETELAVKNESSFFNYQLNIYDHKTDALIGKINRYNFKLHQTNYNVNKKGKNIFNKIDCDARFELYKIYTDIILNLNVDRQKKKWYKTIYGDEIKGTVKAVNEFENELIICSFFYLHHYILTIRRE